MSPTPIPLPDALSLALALGQRSDLDAPRDVVWTLNTGRRSAEVAFDDYLDERAFIVSEMSASLTHEGGYLGRHRYNDGFDRTAPRRSGARASRSSRGCRTPPRP